MSEASLRPALVLLAAGIGSRYGGIKPLAPVGPEGEPLLIVSLGQARAAGFERAVIVVSDATDDAIRSALGDPPVPCTFVRQPVLPGRTKPLGTVDAVCCATGDDASSFGVVAANGDDLYGVAALAAAMAWCTGASTADAAAIVFELARTLLPGAAGGVSRAVVERGPSGAMTRITERIGVARTAGQRSDRAHGSTADDPTAVRPIRDVDGREIDGHAPVSMNLWCLRPRALAALHAALQQFAQHATSDAELGLPHAIDALVRSAGLHVDTLVTDSPWFGVTWASDVADVRAALRSARRVGA